MGFELDAFLGRTSELRKWRQQLPSAAVCELSADLGLVPMTGKLAAEVGSRLGKEAEHLDGAARHREGLRRWAAQASQQFPVAQISACEFGNQSHDGASVWSGGEEVLAGVGLQSALDYLRDRAGVALGDRPIDLGRYRGERAAEKWAAAAAGIANAAPVSPPRTGSRRPSWTFLGGVALFFSVFFLALSFQQGRYEGGGITVHGVVTDKAYSPGSGAGVNARTASFSSYFVLYRFTTTDGRTLDGKDDVLPELWRSLKVGDPVAVEYLAASPDNNQIPEQRAGGRTFLVLGLATLVGGLALVALGRNANRARQLSGPENTA